HGRATQQVTSLDALRCALVPSGRSMQAVIATPGSQHPCVTNCVTTEPHSGGPSRTMADDMACSRSISQEFAGSARVVRDEEAALFMIHKYRLSTTWVRKRWETPRDSERPAQVTAEICPVGPDHLPGRVRGSSTR